MPTPPVVFAHRGGGAQLPKTIDENSWESVEYTAKNPNWILETDVRLTRDGHLMLQHDAFVERVWDGQGLVRDLTWDELSRMRSAHGCRPILLRDALRLYPHLHFNIDAKEPDVVDPLGRLVTEMNAHDRVRVSSFSLSRLRAIRRKYGLKTSLAPMEVMLLKLFPALYTVFAWCFNASNAGDAAQVPIRYGKITVLTRRFVRACQRLGIQVDVWTINDPQQMRHVAELGVDGIITDTPHVAQRTLYA